MACISCKQGNFNGTLNNQGCCNLRAMDIDTPLANIQNGDKNFCFTEITDKICKNLANDEGIHPSATNQNSDCDDLSSLNDLATGSLHNALMTLNMCDVEAYKCWLDSLLSWNWNVDKAVICAMCGLWKIVHCIDSKTKQSVRTVKLWEGNNDIFDLPTMGVSESLEQFDYLDLHTIFGTEHTVIRVSLAGGTGGVPTASTPDKISGNNTYGIGDGSIALKEIGLQFPTSKSVKIHHFQWSITGCYPSSLNRVEEAKFITFSDTTETKKYCNSQNNAQDKPHKILMIEGIISHDTGTCVT